MLDSYERTGSEIEHQFEENMDRSPKQLMVMSYGVFFQWWFFELPLGPPCALEIGRSQSWGQHEFLLISSMKVQPILIL